MLTGREMLRRMGLTIAAVAMAGCISQPLPEPSATMQPTETVTLTATVTDTPTLRPTDTETLTPSLTPERYPIDTVKLNTTPKSYDYLTSHLDEYVQSPDPLADSRAGQVFLDWVKNELIPALGDETKLDRNVYASDGVYYNNELALSGDSKPLMGQPEFFYFEHQNKVYPVLILSLRLVNYIGRTVMVILTEENDMGWGALEKLTEGKLIRGIVLYPRVDCPYIPDIGKQMVAVGLDASLYEDYWRLPAAGHIQTLP